MDQIVRTPWTRFRPRQLVAMILLLALGEVLGIGISYATRTSNVELSRAFAGGAATLLFGALLGGVVTLLIADFDRRRVQRAVQLDFVSKVLTDLKDVYDCVDRGRILIRAHQSAKTYGEQMREFIAARVKLLNVERALKFDERGAPILAIRNNVSAMEQYMRALIDEFEREYKEISRSQSLYEARMKRVLDGSVSAPDTAVELPKNEPWERITKLKSVADFMAPVRKDDTDTQSAKSDYCRRFLDPLDAASSQLRAALRDELA